jgi:hypothetical protein
LIGHIIIIKKTVISSSVPKMLKTIEKQLCNGKTFQCKGFKKKCKKAKSILEQHPQINVDEMNNNIGGW